MGVYELIITSSHDSLVTIPANIPYLYETLRASPPQGGLSSVCLSVRTIEYYEGRIHA